MKKRFGFIVAAYLTASCAFAQTIEPSGDEEIRTFSITWMVLSLWEPLAWV